MFGELYGKLTGTHQNAFAQDSSIITIASFGHDNALPFLSSILGITAACEQYKPFDYYLVNYFYTLDGSKCSTSRGHAIWVHEVINKKHCSSDIIRLYLSSIDVRNDTGNFDSTEFNQFYEKTLEWQNRFILDALPNVPEVDAPCPPHLKEHLNTLLAVQERTLQPHHFVPHEAVNTIQAWLKLGHDLKRQTTSYFWWLQTFSLFLYPFMPKLGKALWQSLGYQQLPTIDDLYSFPLLPRQNSINLRSMIDKEPKRTVRAEEAL
jgi:methionyl-tRNA synthetase